MRRRRLTDKMIEDLKPQAKRYLVYDSVVPGLAVRVSSSGRRTFCLVARFNSKHPSRRSLGVCGKISVERAREKARDWHQRLSRGDDPKPVEVALFKDVAAQFFVHIRQQRRSWECERTVEREFTSRWKDRPMASITRADLLEVTDAAIARGSPYAAHNAWAHVRRVFNYAVARGMLEHSPCDRVRPRDIIGAKEPRQRVLTDDEIRALWSGSERIGYPYGPLWQLLLLTGARKSEVAHAKWSELRGDTLVVPPERFKSNATHMIPLSGLAAATVASLPRSGEYLFGRINGFSKAKRRLDKHMRPATPFVIHDIRRTVRTRLSALRVPHEVAEMVIGHGRKGLARVYDQHHYADEMRDALEKWAQSLGFLLRGSANCLTRASSTIDGETQCRNSTSLSSTTKTATTA